MVISTGKEVIPTSTLDITSGGKQVVSVWDRAESACGCGEQRDPPGADGGHRAGHGMEWASKGGTASGQTSGKSPQARTEMEKPCLCLPCHHRGSACASPIPHLRQTWLQPHHFPALGIPAMGCQPFLHPLPASTPCAEATLGPFPHSTSMASRAWTGIPLLFKAQTGRTKGDPCGTGPWTDVAW